MKHAVPFLITFVYCLVLAHPLAGQGSDDDALPNAYFQELNLPTPNSYRSGTGEPGEDYWQQRADYSISVTLDTTTRRLSGSETIRYTNNSPLPLDYLWLQLDQNLFREGSRGSAIQPADSRWRGAFEGGGFEISNIILEHNGREEPADVTISDTRMRIDLPQPLAARGGSLAISLDFAFNIPEYGADRMGMLDVAQGTVYELAQWYPRMYVHDDVNGWNVMPYLGQGEFYLEYGNYDVELTVPRNVIVAATGALQNPREVLTTEQRRRLDEARESAETVMIVDRHEVGIAASRPDGEGPLTWKFRAENVRDFAWAASQAFMWDASGWEDVLSMSFYPREGIGRDGAVGWEKSTEMVRHSISHYSDMWFRYPYPVAINVAGVVGGMEYPMIVFCSVRARDEALFGVTDHEIGHFWYPMIVGSDERRHAWMDEGFNTFINYYSTLAYYGESVTRTDMLRGPYIGNMMQRHRADQPSYTFPDQIRRESLGFLAYRKPGMGLRILREYILGPERFDPAFREYTRRWAYKHPQPADFFRTMEDVAGEDLDWFWRGWFMGSDVVDQAIVEIDQSEIDTYVTIAQTGGLKMPVEFEISYLDGRTERRQIPVEAFNTADTFVESIDTNEVESVTIDPEGILPDVERRNNTWTLRESVPVSRDSD